MVFMNYEIFSKFKALFNSIYFYYSDRYNYKEINITNAFRCGFDKKRKRNNICIEINNEYILWTALPYQDARIIIKFFRQNKEK